MNKITAAKKIGFLLNVCLGFIIASTAWGIEWTAGPSLPAPQDGYVVAVNGHIYIVGGNASGGVATAVVRALNPDTHTWTSKANMLATRQGAMSISVVGSTIYAIGGGWTTYLSKVEAYDTVTDSWWARASLPYGFGFAGAATANGLIYVAGGSDFSNQYDTLWVYDPVADSWSSKASMSAIRNVLSVVAVGGTIYAIGGTDSKSAAMNLVEAYDPATNTWTTKASMPGPRYNLPASVVGGTIYVFGGLDGASTAVATVWSYDTATDTWTTMTSLPAVHTGWGSGAAIGSTIYIVGGGDGVTQISAVTIGYVYPNVAPNPPSTPTGSTSGLVSTTYNYATSATDPNGDQVKYGWDWNGDGTVDEWSGLVASGTADSRPHTWSTAGTYSVKVKAEDGRGAQSGWSAAISVVISAPASSNGAVSPPVEMGKMVAAPNNLALADPTGKIKLHLKGNAGSSVEIRIYNPAGQFMGKKTVTLNSGGVAMVEYGVEGWDGYKPTLGAYWALAEGGGVKDRKIIFITGKKK
jgi:N-acetylneuraminic acid mutarotase